MPVPDLAKKPKATCLITMVHGTWGRRSRWFQENSDFRRALEAGLGKEHITATVRPFLWSGKNSVFARTRAAKELAELLGSEPDDTSSIVIAHSHGANVAFRAISRLGSRGARIHLITLATPFLRAFPTWSGPSFGETFIFFFAVLSIPVFLLTGAVMVTLTGLDLSNTVFRLTLLSSVVVISAAASALLVRYMLNPSPKVLPDRERKPWAWKPFILAEAVNYDSAGPSAPKLLVIRGVDDEAALALAFGAIGTSINRFMLTGMWKVLYPLATVLFFALVLFSWLGGYFLNSESSLHVDPSLIATLAGASYLLFTLGTVVFLLLPGLFNSRFGWEFLVGAMRCEVATDSVPDSTHAQIVTLQAPYQPPIPRRDTVSILRHKIYDYPDCVPEIVKWIKEHVR